MEWILILYIWSGTEQYCMSYQRCSPIKGSSTVTTTHFSSKKACEEAAAKVHEWAKPKDHQSQGPDFILHECVRR